MTELAQGLAAQTLRKRCANAAQTLRKRYANATRWKGTVKNAQFSEYEAQR